MPATIIVPGGGECKRYRVPENSLGTCSTSPECSVSSAKTASIETTSQVTKMNQAPSEDFFSDSSLIFVPSEKKKPNRQTPPQKVVFGSTDIRYRNCKEGSYGTKNAMKDKKAPKTCKEESITHQVNEKAEKRANSMMKSNNVNLKGMTTGVQMRETQDIPGGNLINGRNEQIVPAFLQMAPTDTNHQELEPEKRLYNIRLNKQDMTESAEHRDGDIGVAARMRDDPVPEEATSHSSWRIPPVVCSPQVHIRGQDSDIVSRAIRSHLWESPSQPPSIVTPSILHLIRREGDMLETAVETLLDQRKIGLSLEGWNLGRKGELKFLVISTETEVFIFDMAYFGVNAFKWGLYSVLGNEKCVKVVHDFRAGSDLLYHQYGLELVNVFDTMAGHIVVTNWMVERKVTRAKRLHCLVLDYLGVVDLHQPGPCHLDTGSQEEQVTMAARNCLYLPALSSIIEQAMELPVTRLCQEVMGAALVSTDQELRQMRLSPHTAPDTSKCLPLWKQ